MEAGAVNQQRRLFLRGDLAAKGVPPRPPWALPETQFTARCTRCDRCCAACPAQLIVRGSGGYPEMDFSRSGCDFCGACLRACDAAALLAERPTAHNAWRHRVDLLDHCLASRGVVCRSCGEVCAAQAVTFRPQLGGRSLPELSAAACNGCGSCVAVCPVQALRIRPPAEERHA